MISHRVFLCPYNLRKTSATRGEGKLLLKVVLKCGRLYHWKIIKGKKRVRLKSKDGCCAPHEMSRRRGKKKVRETVGQRKAWEGSEKSGSKRGMIVSE